MAVITPGFTMRDAEKEGDPATEPWARPLLHLPHITGFQPTLPPT